MLATSSPSHNCPVPDKRRSKNWVETAATWAAYCQLVALWTCRAARSFFKTLAVSQLLSRRMFPLIEQF